MQILEEKIKSKLIFYLHSFTFWDKNFETLGRQLLKIVNFYSEFHGFRPRKGDFKQI